MRNVREETKKDKPKAKQKVKKAEKRVPRVTETAKVSVSRNFSPKLYKIDDEVAIVRYDVQEYISIYEIEKEVGFFPYFMNLLIMDFEFCREMKGVMNDDYHYKGKILK